MNKYIDNPATVSDSKVLLSDLPPIQWSICQKLTIGNCVVKAINYGGDFGFLFANDYYNDLEEKCEFEPNVIPNHAKSKE